MPFRSYTQFDRKTLDAMAAAYDAAVLRLSLKSNDPRTGKLAAQIVTLASEGIWDVATLVERAVAGLRQSSTDR